MLQRRFYSSLFFALALLFAQQGSTLHTLRHALAEQAEQQQKKHTSPAHDCKQCLSYAQFGGTLNSGLLSFDFATDLRLSHTQQRITFISRHSNAANARGPPPFQRSA